MGEALVFTTAEIVLGELRDVSFGREHCALSGWPELGSNAGWVRTLTPYDAPRPDRYSSPQCIAMNACPARIATVSSPETACSMS